MKLARKLTIGLALGIFCVMAVNAYVRVQREIRLFEADRLDEERLHGRILRAAVEAVWASEGEERAIELVADANQALSEVQFRWVWLDDEGESSAVSLSRQQKRALIRGASAVRMPTKKHVYVYLPVRLGDGSRPAALEIRESLDLQQSYLRDSVTLVAMTTLGVTAVCGLIAMGLGMLFVGRPMRRLYDQTRRIGRGDFSQRLAIHQRDEIGELAGEINAMCDQLVAANERAAKETETRIATLEQLRHVDRLKTVGELASGVAHELGTPLNVVMGHARIMMKDPDARDSVMTGARVIVEQAERMTAIIRQLLDFARRRTPKLEAWDLRAIVRETVGMLSPLARKRGVAVSFAEGEAPGLAHVDRFQVQQVITNLTMNAIQAVPSGGHVDVEVEGAVAPENAAAPRHEGGFVRVTVRDDGPGIPADAVGRIFEPFFTTKSVGEGTGLGLSVAYGIVQEHGGWIDVESREGKGSTFAVYLQSAPADAPEARP
jgi:two-component system NtrC family sensor kinase